MPRIRPEGGTIGVNNTPTTATATGMWTMHDVARNIRNLTWPEDILSGDPYFDLNSLLFHADSTNGKTNTSYIDSSPNAYTATASGRPYQGTASPFSLNGWSNYFNGSSYFTYASNAAFGLGTGDFTIETWVYLISNGVSGGTNILDFRATATAIPLTINITNTGSGNIVGAYTSFGATGVGAQGAPLALHTWYHIAFTRTSGTWRIFINGVSQTLTGSGYNGDLGSSKPLTVAATVGGGSPLNAYISNLRIVKGSSLYTVDFNPSTIELTAVSGTSLLTCQSNRFRDNSTNNFSATPTGAPTVEPFSPFNPATEYSTTTVGGSAYFNGSTDYITLPNNMTAVGNAAYTLEGWFYPTTVAAAEIPIVKLYNASQTIELRIVSSKIQGRIGNSATVVGGNTTLYPNQWYHFALVKSGTGTTTVTLYINGVAEATTQTDSTTYTAFTTPRVGANQTPNLYYTGRASNVRFIRAVAQYTSNFTPPTAPFTSGSELFLLNFTNAGIIDQTSKNNLATFDGAAISTAQSQFGGSSVIFDGTLDYLSTDNIHAGNFGTGDFTVEFWMRGSAAGTIVAMVGTQTVSGFATAGMWRISNRLNSANGLWFNYTTGSAFVDIALSSTNINDGAWHHIAVTRASGTLRAFIDGAFASSATVTQNLNSNRFLFIGYNPQDSVYYNGYIDELRITRGYARYTSSFTSPTVPYKNR
jgi:hypothetical protein